MPRETIPAHDGKVSVGWTKDRIQAFLGMDTPQLRALPGGGT